jgi:hypothetical protein|tara:strand:- start:773 stop:1198 length:426 start_codon:yes stop_codon:yes gene_type:complete
MLDHLSEYPSPKGMAAVKDILNSLKETPLESNKSYKKDKNILKKIALDIVIKTPPRCSYTGWIMGELDDYTYKTIHIYKKKILLLRKFKGIIKSIVFINLLYKESLERYYAPNGKFERYSAILWNPILNNPDKPPPTPHTK